MKLGKVHSGDELPKKDGWYMRDYRNPPKPTSGELPPFSVDKFMGGLWYVQNDDGLNDAWYESLPWQKIKD